MNGSHDDHSSMQSTQCKNHIDRCVLVSACLALLVSHHAHAGGSLLVDDAAVTPVGDCQVEAWARAYLPGAELTAVPACNIGGTEFSLGVTELLWPRSGPLLGLGAKHLWRDFDHAAFGIGTALAAVWSADSERVEVWSINLPASVAVDAERNTILHANLGWLETRGISRGITAGMGLEQIVTSAATLIAEFYVQPDQLHVGQLGMRCNLNQRATVDVLIGQQSQSATGPWFVTLGFNLLLR